MGAGRSAACSTAEKKSCSKLSVSVLSIGKRIDANHMTVLNEVVLTGADQLASPYFGFYSFNLIF